MLYPTIDELTQGKYNRYELALATAKCARLITNEYVRQHDIAEKSITGTKETDRPLNTMIDKELRDEKAVRVAIGRIHSGEYSIDPLAGERERAEREAREAAKAAEVAEENVVEAEDVSEAETDETSDAE